MALFASKLILNFGRICQIVSAGSVEAGDEGNNKKAVPQQPCQGQT